jgi:hypothetical protein
VRNLWGGQEGGDHTPPPAVVLFSEVRKAISYILRAVLKKSIS